MAELLKNSYLDDLFFDIVGEIGRKMSEGGNEE